MLRVGAEIVGDWATHGLTLIGGSHVTTALTSDINLFHRVVIGSRGKENVKVCKCAVV